MTQSYGWIFKLFYNLGYNTLSFMFLVFLLVDFLLRKNSVEFVGCNSQLFTQPSASGEGDPFSSLWALAGKSDSEPVQVKPLCQLVADRHCIQPLGRKSHEAWLQLLWMPHCFLWGKTLHKTPPYDVWKKHLKLWNVLTDWKADKIICLPLPTTWI